MKMLKLKYAATILLFFILTSLNVKGLTVVNNPTANAKQMVLVVAENWDSTQGVLQYFERETVKRSWRQASDKIPVNLGFNGMGWGIGLHGAALTTGPEIREGAKKSPAGVFAITLAFGKDEDKQLGMKIPYKQITETVFCPDDPYSKYYNSIVDTKTVTKDWKSAEDMNQYMQEGVYAFGFVVNHNYDKPKAGYGSCFFVHVHRKAGSPTHGCTAFAPELVKKLVTWLDNTKKPVLVQLPRDAYNLFKSKWELPNF